jgi:hypothetical protein
MKEEKKSSLIGPSFEWFSNLLPLFFHYSSYETYPATLLDFFFLALMPNLLNDPFKKPLLAEISQFIDGSRNSQ